jgi:hypothetical protein
MFKKPVIQALVSIVVAILVSALFVIGCTPPETVTAPPGGTTPPPAQSSKIEDLAYITILTSSYSDDPDPEADGIALDVSFYDSKSEPVTFRDIPVTVTIELYGYSDVLDTFNHEKMELVYQQQVTVDHSMRISEMFGKYIRIPFENVTVDQSKYCEFGTIKVTATTPEQGDFQDMEDLVILYAER